MMRLRASPISSARSAELSADYHHGLAHHLAGAERRGRKRVLVHQMGEQLLVERAPVDADAHRLAVADRGLDDVAELLVLLVLEADIARIDAVLVERLRAGRMIGQKLVPDIVEVADDRHVDAHPVEAFLDVRHGGCGLVAVDRDAHDLRAGARQRRHLGGGAGNIGGVRIGHRLHDDRGVAADGHAADIDRYGLAPVPGARLGSSWAPSERDETQCQTGRLASTWRPAQP